MGWLKRTIDELWPRYNWAYGFPETKDCWMSFGKAILWLRQSVSTLHEYKNKLLSVNSFSLVVLRIQLLISPLLFIAEPLKSNCRGMSLAFPSLVIILRPRLQSNHARSRQFRPTTVIKFGIADLQSSPTPPPFCIRPANTSTQNAPMQRCA